MSITKELPAVENGVPVPTRSGILGIPAAKDGTPIPIPREKRNWSFLDALEVGQSAVIEARITQAVSAVHYHKRLHPAWRYTIRTVSPDSVRVWRIE